MSHLMAGLIINTPSTISSSIDKLPKRICTHRKCIVHDKEPISIPTTLLSYVFAILCESLQNLSVANTSKKHVKIASALMNVTNILFPHPESASMNTLLNL